MNDDLPLNLNRDQIQWAMMRRGVISDCVFSMENNKFFFNTSTGIFCYDIESGKQKWKNDKILNSNNSFLFENILITADTRKNCMYYIDIGTGKIVNKIDWTDYIFMIQIESENTLLIVSRRSEYQFQVQRYNVFSGAIEDIIVLNGRPKGQIEWYNGSIVLTTWGKEEGLIYIVDGNSCKIKMKDTIYDNIMYFNKDFVCLQNSVYYIKRVNDRTELTKTDIVTGGTTESYFLPFSLSNSCLRDDGENILVHGDALYLFKTTVKEFVRSSDGFDTEIASAINERHVVFADGGTAYYYWLDEGLKKRIFDLKGMEIFRFFMNKNLVILITASNVNKTLADNLHFTIVVLKVAF
jgi:hypothetical protein